MSQPRSSFALWFQRMAIPGLVKGGKVSAADLQENSKGIQCLEVKGCKRNQGMSVKKSEWDREAEDTPQETEARPPKFTSTYERGRGVS